MSESTGLGESRVEKILNLLLDPHNPRLPESKQGISQPELAEELDLGFEAFTIAESIASHGFFKSEPLIVIPSDSEEGKWITVEGNRRLTALLALAREDIRANFPDPDKWNELAAQANVTLNTEVPIVVVRSRAEVVPIIGFRHISGILAWTPYAQARYIAKLVEDDGISIAEVSKLIGIEKTRAGNLYRDQAIAKQATAFGIDTGPVESSFSLLTVAMNNVKLREHIGASLGSRLEPGQAAIPEEKKTQLRELLTWVYGDGEAAPKITDSREMTKLGKVVGSEIGLAALRSGATLALAEQTMDEDLPNAGRRLAKHLTAARNSLQSAAAYIEEGENQQEIVELIEEIRDALNALDSETSD
jgi:hypothetical protein